MSSTEPRENGAEPAPEAYRDAFRVADELNVHGSGCVCPTCAARLPGLLVELARAIEAGADRPVA